MRKNGQSGSPVVFHDPQNFLLVLLEPVFVSPVFTASCPNWGCDGPSGCFVEKGEGQTVSEGGAGTWLVGKWEGASVPFVTSWQVDRQKRVSVLKRGVLT